MDVSARFDEARNEYQVGIVSDGVFVPVVSVPQAQVDGHVATVKEQQASQPQPPTPPAEPAPAPPAPAPAGGTA